MTTDTMAVEPLQNVVVRFTERIMIGYGLYVSEIAGVNVTAAGEWLKIDTSDGMRVTDGDERVEEMDIWGVVVPSDRVECVWGPAPKAS